MSIITISSTDGPADSSAASKGGPHDAPHGVPLGTLPSHPRDRGATWPTVLAVTALLALLVGCLIGRTTVTPGAGSNPVGKSSGAGYSSAVRAAYAQAPAVLPAGPLTDPERRTVELFEAASSGVVNITTAARVQNPWTRSVTEQPSGTGSGFVWDANGHIITNYHVIRQASSATVNFVNGAQLPAELVGVSAHHDHAVLRIDADALDAMGLPIKPLPLGASADLRVGQNVYAIGSPFGLDHTLTTGVVSARERQIRGVSGREIEGVIQTDAAINPGNSGGPLLDSSGRVIAVNTAIYSPSGGSAGIGFGVPIDTVRRVVPQVIATGRYRPPQIGIYAPDSISREINRRLGTRGIVIAEVVDGSPAESAGLIGMQRNQIGQTRIGDILQAVNGESVESLNDLFLTLDPLSPGDQVELTIVRDGETIEVPVTLGQLE